MSNVLRGRMRKEFIQWLIFEISNKAHWAFLVGISVHLLIHVVIQSANHMAAT